MSEGLENYEVTPEDLGCLGEPENDPGVVEEAVGSGSGETNVPIRKSFASIPFEQKQRARKLYDGFTVKDISFEDFCIELYALESPALMQADLRDMITEKEDRNRVQAANMNIHSMNRSIN